MDTLVRVLEASGKKNGFDKPVTISHLLNMIRLAQKIENQRQEQIEKDLNEAYMEIYADECGNRD